jgi:hypothetical protein
MGRFSIPVQMKIHKEWEHLATYADPREAGINTSCDKHREYVVVMFPMLPFKFVYKIVENENKILLIKLMELPNNPWSAE